MKKIIVIGSLNMDTVIEIPQRPQGGETISGKSFTQVPGGKGANQAYAAGKLGGDVRMIGAVADDAPGIALKENLEQVDVDTAGIAVIPGATTGQAFITVDDTGENSIIIIAGTNAAVTKEMIDKNVSYIEESDIVIMQFEIPLDTVEYVKELAVKLGKIVIVDPAPAVPNLPDSFWKDIDYIKPNETELEILTGRKHTLSRSASSEGACIKGCPDGYSNLDEVKEGARLMLAKGVKNVLVTLGGDGCLFVTADKEEYFKANKVKAVDTTAAGDSFTAAFALALSKGENCSDSIRFGQKVSGIAVTRKGAQTSIPTLEEVGEA